MNADDLAMLCSALSVREREGLVGTLNVGLKDKGERRLSLCLVGKILVAKLVSRVAFIEVISKVWRMSEGVEIEWIEGNIFAFHFKNLKDRKRILAGVPWTFDRAMIIFDEPIGDGDIQNLSFNKIEFWIQIHNLPLICMTEEIGIFFGENDRRTERH
ncbi:hypothetical protein Q3G72_002695 [Acer saccharum]|nr:hypothetical protein Q3G72_002695 [Acer saccharum]